MNQKIFNVKLYMDKMKQLRLMALICGFLTLLISLLIPIMTALSRFDEYYDDEFNHYLPSASESIPILIPYVFIAGIFFTFHAFSFLNKRNESDFYHSLPNTRICTYLSIGAAVMTWIAGTVTVTTLLTWIANLIFDLPFNNYFIPYLLLSFIGSGLLISGVSMLAVSLTGTRFSNVVLMLMLLLLPRLIIQAFTSMVTLVAPIIDAEKISWITDPAINIPFSILYDTMNFFEYDSSFMDSLISINSIIYTIVLGLIYVALGAFGFRQRHSETAGMSAQNKILQTVYRCALALPFLLLAEYFVVGGDTEYMFNIILIIVIISLVSYFLFEIITTKKVKSMLKAAPFYLIPLVFCALLAVGANLFGNALLNTEVNADNIKYVTINGIFSEMEYEESDNFGDYAIRGIRYDDPELIKILAEGLEKSVKKAKTGDLYGGDLSIGFKLNNGKKIHRLLSLNSVNNKRFNELRAQNPDYRIKSRLFPTDDEITYIGIDLNKTQTKRIWRSFKEEAKALSDEDFESAINTKKTATLDEYEIEDSVDEFFYFGINVIGRVKTYNFVQSWPISDKTPKTIEMYYQYINDDYMKKAKSMVNTIIDGNIPKDLTYSARIDIRNIGKNPINLFGSISAEPTSKSEMETGELTEKELKSILKIIRKSEYRTARAGDITLNLSVDTYNEDTDESVFADIYLQITKEELEAIRSVNNTTISAGSMRE